MYGAILGDIIGSPYEFDMGNKSKDFPLFSKNSTFTDDTVMTIAVAEAFMGAPDDEEVADSVHAKMGTSVSRCRLRLAVLRLAGQRWSAAIQQLGQRICHAGIPHCVAL